jgi:DNA (cytosine-5)-methyltransferase 1
MAAKKRRHERRDEGGARRLHLDVDEPCPTVMAGGVGSVNTGQYRLPTSEEAGEMPKVTQGSAKPPFRVPSMAEIAAIPWNGFTAASTFSGCGGSSLGYRMAGFRVAWASEFVEAARDSYRANMSPGTILDDRDIREVQPEEVLEAMGMEPGQLDLLDGSPPCFAAGTPVLTLQGVKPIEEVKEGDLAWTHMGRWKPVVGVMSRKASTVLVEGTMECTPEHPFWSRTNLNVRGINLDEVRWTDAKNLHDEFVATPAKFHAVKVPNAPEGFRYCEAFWYFVGRWLGDGWVRQQDSTRKGEVGHGRAQHPSPVPCEVCGKPSQENAKVHGSFTNYCGSRCRTRAKNKAGKPRWAVHLACANVEFNELMDKITGMGVTINWSQGKGNSSSSRRIIVSRRSLVEWLTTWFGKGAAGKTMPGWLFGADEAVRKAVFQGYVDADGSELEPGQKFKTGTISPCLRAGFVILANTLGFTTSVNKRRYKGELAAVGKGLIQGRIVNLRQSWATQVIKDDGRYTREEFGVRWRRMRKEVMPGRTDVTVYDLTVADDHSFVADTFIVHNCASFSTAGKRQAGWGTVKKYSDREQRTDDLFFEYVRLLRGIMPKTFVAENVSGLVKGTAKGYFLMILKELKDSGYRVTCRVLDAQWLGVPQQRQRTIFVGVRNDLADAAGNPLQPCHPAPLPYRYSVREAIPWIADAVEDTGSNTEGFNTKRDEDFSGGPSPTVRMAGKGHLLVRKEVKIGHNRIEETSLRSADDPAPSVRASKPAHLTVEPEADMTGKATGAEFDRMGRPGTQSDKYFQLVRPDVQEPCPTVTAAGGNAGLASVCHPTERRKFSIAELKRICAFPDSFVLTGSYSQQWERLGRAVPPVMMRHIAETVRDMILRKAADA